jgi:hypothetical protein
MFKQFLAKRTIRFGYTPVDRSHTPFDDIDAALHLKTKETTGSVGRIIRHWRPDSGIYSNCWTAATWFHGFVNGDKEPEIAVSISLDGTLRLWDFINRRFFEEPNVANRFREYRKDAILEFDGFFNPENVSIFPLMSQRFETDFEFINVFVPQIRKCGFEIFYCFEHRLLPDGLWG